MTEPVHGVVGLGGHPWAGLRNLADWQLQDTLEYWNRALAECRGDDARHFVELSRTEVQQEIDRRRRLGYQCAERPFDLEPVVTEVKQRASVLDIFATRAVVGPFYADPLSRSFQRRVTMFHCPVYRESNRWTCFGCGSSGDVIAAVMKLEGLDFVEAVLQLARECGVDVPRREQRATRQVERW
jgi:hypothetical protein